MYSIVTEVFKKEIFGINVLRDLKYYVVPFRGMFYSFDKFNGDIDSDDDGQLTVKDENFKYIIACAATKERLLYLTRKTLTNRIIKELKNNSRKGIIKPNQVRRVLNLRDGICYHITKSTKRENIDLKGLLPGTYESDARLSIDRTIDNLRININEKYHPVSREKSVFLYPSISPTIITEKSDYTYYDVYAVKVDKSKVWLAPSKINEVLTFDYRLDSLEIDNYFDHLRNLGKLYWLNSCNADKFNFDTTPLNEYEALAYSSDSIKEIKRVGMFNQDGVLFPLDNFDFFR